jgi:hypothetical protein
LESIGTLEFVDLESNDNAFAVVRATAGAVGLALSLEKDGDIDVLLPLETCRSLIDLLNSGLQRASRS